MGEYQDQTKRCVEKDCNAEFMVTAGEQEFFASKGFSLPKRCKKCRTRRKREDSSPFGAIARQQRYGER